MSKSKMIVRTKFIDLRLSLDRGDLLLPGGAVRDFRSSSRRCNG